jgi:hypothetical protein
MRCRKLPVLLAGALLILGAGMATANAQKRFASPERAAEALVTAIRSNEHGALLRVFGRTGAKILFSGDPVQDADLRAKFLAAYDESHRISVDRAKAILFVGRDDFAFPLPLIRRNMRWRFDIRAGREEILTRRVGRNELSAIQACLAYVDAQNEYAATDRGVGTGVYAQRIVSTPGKMDGLYWPSRTDTDRSPLGELFARATAQGYRAGARAPYHGYYYRILTRQGPNSAGGALSFIVGGKMIGGFALIAYPAEYGNSGLKTFMVNYAGVVFAKDLGPRTVWLARQFNAFDPDASWTKVDTAAAQ